MVSLLAAKAVFFATQDQDWEASLKDARAELRIQAADALGVPGSLRGIEALIGTLDDRDPFVRSSVRMALLRIGGPAIDGLLTRQSSDKQYDRISAATGLLNMVGRTENVDLEGFLRLVDESKILRETSWLRCSDGTCLEHWVVPLYPPVARTAFVTGRVWVTFTVDKSGEPKEVSAKGHPLLVQSAAETLKKWKYRIGGSSPVSRWVLFEYELVGPSKGSPSTAVDLLLPNHVLVVSSPQLLGAP
jgi:hypothetical protein